ncbi:hypothetical protein LTR55_012003, partial [Exophiala xenobiotica]
MYTRTYSGSSAGQLVSAKARSGDPLSDTVLLEEFRNHANKWSRKSTALVSVSDRIVDSLKRAFDKHYKDGDLPADIWIAFIEVPSTTDKTTVRIHAAKELAKACELPEPNLFAHEFLFEWAIPKEYVLHEVSLHTLMKRELQEYYFLQPSTSEVRNCLARELRRSDPGEIGLTLGFLARKFGARAPLDWISHQIFHDCVWVDILAGDLVRLDYAHGDIETVDFQFFCDLEDGIETSLCDWWLADRDFFLDCEEFKEMRDVIQDSMTWDLIDFWETWHDVDRDGTIKELSATEK